MSDAKRKPDLQGISEILSDALMRANSMETCMVIYVSKDDEVCTSFHASRIQRLGMLTHVLFHEMARSVKEVDDYESEDLSP